MKITKNGSFIEFEIGKANPVKFDCRDFTIISYTGRTVKNFPSDVRQGIQTDIERKLYDAMRAAINGSTYVFYMLEKFITVLDKVAPWDIPSECPKGFLAWCDKEGKAVSNTNLQLFNSEQAMRNMPKEVMEVYEFCKPHINLLNAFTEWTLDKKIAFCKIFKTSMKTFSWSFQRDVQNFIRFVNNLYRCEWEKMVDTNRNFDYNKEQIDATVNKERNEKILAWEDKFREIEQLSNEEYVIIVPKTMQDFTNEGKQQNNCVGHFYHESIARHDNFIYFIRKRNNPTHSWMTCRYCFTLYTPSTAEYRFVNNDRAEWLDIMTKIDAKIKEIDKRHE